MHTDGEKVVLRMQQAAQLAPPPVPSVARRGKLSMGKVLDVYWHCAEPRDQYLGRVMAGLNLLKYSLKILPPHFYVKNPWQ